MLTLPSQTKVYLCRDAVDMRKSINGLSIVVVNQLALDAKASALFVFFNRRCNKVKILYWDRTGFALWYKSLSRGRYRLPQVNKRVAKLSVSDLSCLLEGVDLTHTQRHAVV